MIGGLPTVSIGVPVFNSEKFLETTLLSLLNQTYRNFELIVSDNASTDRTADICQRLAAGDSRVRYVRQPHNIGLPHNYNAVVALARGKYFKWNSSNDLCDERVLEKCVAALERRSDAVLAYPKTRLFNDERGTSRFYNDNMDLQAEDPVERYVQCGDRLVLNNVISGVIRLQRLKATTLHWDYLTSDVELTLELTLHGKFIEVPDVHFHRRMQPGAHYAEGHENTHHVYYPADARGAARRQWSRLRQRAMGVIKAPVSVRDKLRLLDWNARRAWWTRHELLGLRKRDESLGEGSPGSDWNDI